MKRNPHPSSRRLRRSPVRKLGKGFESLENRSLLAGDLVRLAPDQFSIDQDSQDQTLRVLANDSFDVAYVGDRAITSVSAGSKGGEIRIADDGRSVIYSPPPGFVSPDGADAFGKELFVYVVDGQFTETATVTIRPAASSDSYSFLTGDSQKQLNVLDNDQAARKGADGGRITSISSTTGGGQLEISSDGRSLLYTPAPNYSGTEVFSYVIDDTYEARVNVELRSPVRPDYYNLLRNSDESFFPVSENDCFGYGNCFSPNIHQVTAVDQPAHGTARIGSDGLSIVYAPEADYVGNDTFTYKADGQFQTTVTVWVGAPDDTFAVAANSASVLSVLVNDRFRPGYAGERRITSVEDVYGASNATVTISEDGQAILFTPKTDFVGYIQLKYTVDEQYSAQVTINVQAVANDDYMYSCEGMGETSWKVLANDFFPAEYTGARRITAVSASEHGGEVSISKDGQSVSYRPAPGFHGADQFTYTIDDQFEARVQTQVQAMAVDDYSFVYQFTQSNAIYAVGNDGNCSTWQPYYPVPGGVDGVTAQFQSRGELSITSVGTPDHGGVVEIAPDGKTLLFTPSPEFTGTEEFSYTVNGQFTGTVRVYVSSVLSDDSINVRQNDENIVVAPLTNDLFVSNYRGAGKVTAVGPSTHGGTVQRDATGKTVLYTPAPDFHGQDSFTYSVDGVSTATVNVNVLRGVRDDRYHVEADATASTLPVLLNDDFDRLYAGKKQITAVTQPDQGGTVAIGPNGHSLEFTPVTGFLGTAHFSYRVDGKYVADVSVAVGSNRSELTPAFSSTSDLSQWLLESGLSRYEHLFGQEQSWWAYSGWGYENVVYASLDGAKEHSEAAGPSHSDTNVQVAGVDEGDIVETDGNFVYVLTGNELVIVDSFPATGSSVASRYRFSGTPAAEFLQGDLLTVISHTHQSSPWWGRPGIAVDFAGGWMPPTAYSGVTVTVLNVHDRSAPTLVSETQLDGDFFQARAMGDYVYVVARNGLTPPEPQTTCRDVPPDELKADPADSPLIWPRPDGQICTYESREAYIARASSFANSMLPHYTSYGAKGEVARSGLLVDASDIHGDRDDATSFAYAIVAFDVASPDPGPVATTAVMTGYQPTLFASENDLYILDQQYHTRPEDSTTTRIWQVHLDRDQGEITPVARGEVPGRVINQFSMDEHDGTLRVATTASSSSAAMVDNNVFVLREDGGEFEVVGSLQNLAPGESIFGVRFFGERAIVVTYRTIDPLFTLDLSNPEQPAVAGALKLPGFSTYIQPIDADHILTFGRSGPNGWDGPPQISLFDISDLSRPTLIDQAFVGRNVWSETAWNDHHAVSYFPEYQVLAIPYNDVSWWNGAGQKHESFVFKIDPTQTARSSAGIASLGVVTGDSTALRNVRIDDALFAIFENSIEIVDVEAPGNHLRHVTLRTPTSGETGGSDGPPELTPATIKVLSRLSPTPFDDPGLGRAISAAQKSLAEEMQVREESFVLVTAEQDQAAEDRFRIVLRGDDGVQHLLTAGAEGEVAQLDSGFEFSTESSVAVWHNGELPADTNGDTVISAIDALGIINDLNLFGARALKAIDAVRAVQNRPRVRLDVNGDGFSSALDALLVINDINGNPVLVIPTGMAEGEPLDGVPPHQDFFPSPLVTEVSLVEANIGQSTASPAAATPLASPDDAIWADDLDWRTAHDAALRELLDEPSPRLG